MKKSNQCCVSDEALQQAFKIDELGPGLTATTLTNRDQSKKFDGGKLRMELIPTSAYIGLGRVLTHGAEKYGPNTWQKVEYERYVGALIRHLIAFIDNPSGVDSDSGLKHSEHLLANAVFLNDAVAHGRLPLSTSECKCGLNEE